MAAASLLGASSPERSAGTTFSVVETQEPGTLERSAAPASAPTSSDEARGSPPGDNAPVWVLVLLGTAAVAGSWLAWRLSRARTRT